MLEFRDQPSRIWSLDAVRGLAACAVVLFHNLNLFPQFAAVPATHSGWIATVFGYSPLHLLWAGQEAVIVFFVLSGYVLSDQFWSGRQKPYLSFVVSRWFRLYPTYIAAVAITAGIAAMVIYLNGPEAARWCSNLQWKLGACASSDWRLLTRSETIALLTLYLPALMWVNPVIWTLAVEFHVSMVFPIAIYFMRWSGWLSVLASAVAAWVAMKTIYHFIPYSTREDYYPIITSLSNVWYFVLGAELCRRKLLFSSLTAKIPVWAHWAILAAGCALLLWDWLFWFLPWQFPWRPWYSDVRVPQLYQVAWGLGSAIIIVSARHFPTVRSALEIPVLRWIGERSYGLYLVHYPILALLVMLTATRNLVWTTLLLLLPISLFAADLLHRYVELPGIAAGKALLKKKTAPLPGYP